MLEQAVQQVPTPAPPPPPGVPATTPPPGGAATTTVAQAPQAPGTAVDLSRFSINQLRRMISELRDQRQQLASRREGISGSYENASGANREGIGERLRVLDANIIAYEAEITRVGREIAARGGETSTPPPSGGIPPGMMSEDDAAGMAFGFSFATLILAVFFTRRFMRKRYAGMPASAKQPNLIASNERLERIEQAVDTIAVEVERVSENQRFMTRLMTETQLGDTIKDVRKSAELAKSAAESSG